LAVNNVATSLFPEAVFPKNHPDIDLKTSIFDNTVFTLTGVKERRRKSMLGLWEGKFVSILNDRNRMPIIVKVATP
jgi:hypothetical protein